MRGALVFIAAFLLFLVITLAYPDLPPGNMIYKAVVGSATTDYPVFGIGASTLATAVFNGIVYGVIIWLIFTVADRATKKKPKKTESQQPAPNAT